MKLSRIELAEFTAAARLFPSRVIKPGDRMADGAKVTDINMDERGHVWVNRGAFVMPATSLVYWVPERGETEWMRRFADRSGLPIDATDEELRANMARSTAELMGEPPPVSADGYRCTACNKFCASAAGLAAHMRGHK